MSAPDLTRKPCPGCADESLGNGVAGYCESCTGLRDQFAAHSLTGMLASETSEREATIETSAKFAYRYADAMLAARKVRS